jgi:amidohydrolase
MASSGGVDVDVMEHGPHAGRAAGVARGEPALPFADQQSAQPLLCAPTVDEAPTGEARGGACQAHEAAVDADLDVRRVRTAALLLCALMGITSRSNAVTRAMFVPRLGARRGPNFACTKVPDDAELDVNLPAVPEALWQHMVELRRGFHQVPELAFKEEKTAALVIAELERLGIPWEYQGVGSAVIGRIAAAGPRIALRAEMDALPGYENTDLPFASTLEGKMHACGHDAHMAMVLGAARLLADAPPPADVVLVFQPAEERGGGARTVIASGALEGVAAIFAGHVTQHYGVGEIMVADGVITAQSDGFVIDVQGRGGHGARPHEATDAVIIAGFLVIALQTLVSREVDPLHPSVVTVGMVKAGTAANVIAADAHREGSIRTTLPAVRSHLHAGIRRMAKALGDLHNARLAVEIREGYPPVVNSVREARLARRAAQQVVGEAGLVQLDHPSMGGEDFSYYLEKIPGCYVRFGARPANREFVPLHSPAFDIDESVLRVGAAFFDRVVREAAAEYR